MTWVSAVPDQVIDGMRGQPLMAFGVFVDEPAAKLRFFIHTMDGQIWRFEAHLATPEELKVSEPPDDNSN